MPTLKIAIPGKVITKNDYDRFNPRTKTRYVTPEARAWMKLVGECALEARQRSDWPSDIWQVARCKIEFRKYNQPPLMDPDGGSTIVMDALQGILYGNDRVAWNGGAPPSEDTGGEPWLELTVTLEALCSPLEAKALRERREAALERALIRKKTKRKSKTGAAKKSKPGKAGSALPFAF